MRQDIPTIREAVAKHLADAEARNLKPESVKKMRDVVERRLLAYCTNEGYRVLRQLDVDAVREFRNELVKDYSANSARKRLEYIRAFFRFCHQSGWITANPSTVIKPPKADPSPTLPFERTEIDRMLTVADTFTATGRFKDGNRKRIRAMITEKHYSPWVKARQDQLEQSVRLTWAS